MPLQAGTRVRYHGSLEDYHGVGTVVGVMDYDHPEVTSDDGHRYTIRFDDGKHIYNVRRQSFTEYADETVLAVSE